jgi:Ser/Thr protein kinase RdoA (MazF antagonist)
VTDDDAAAVAATFDLGAVAATPALAARGANGFIWKVVTDRGAFAVKRLQPWIDEPAVPFDVGVQLAAVEAGVPLPLPVLTPEGAAFVDSTRVYEWVDADEALDTPVDVDRATEIGTLLGRLHRLEIEPPPAFNVWYEVPPTRDDWQDVVRQGEEAGASWGEWLERELDFLGDIGRTVGAPRTGEVITCHRDFAPGNVLPSAADGSLVVLDWENAGPMQADAELAWTIVFWACEGDRADVDAAQALHDAYRAVYDGAAPIVAASFHASVVTHLNFLRVNLWNTISEDLNDEFAHTWVERLHPDGLRRRLQGIEQVAAALVD